MFPFFFLRKQVRSFSFNSFHVDYVLQCKYSSFVKFSLFCLILLWSLPLFIYIRVLETGKFCDINGPRSGCSMSEHGVIIDWGNWSDRRICPLANLIRSLFLTTVGLGYCVCPLLWRWIWSLDSPRHLLPFGLYFRACSGSLAFLIFQSSSSNVLFPLDNLVTCRRISSVVLLSPYGFWTSLVRMTFPPFLMLLLSCHYSVIRASFVSKQVYPRVGKVNIWQEEAMLFLLELHILTLRPPPHLSSINTESSKNMDGIWNRYNLKSTGRIYTFGVLKCSEKFKVLELP